MALSHRFQTYPNNSFQKYRAYLSVALRKEKIKQHIASSIVSRNIPDALTALLVSKMLGKAEMYNYIQFTKS